MSTSIEAISTLSPLMTTDGRASNIRSFYNNIYKCLASEVMRFEADDLNWAQSVPSVVITNENVLSPSLGIVGAAAREKFRKQGGSLK